MNVSATPIPSGTLTKSRIEYIDLLKAFAIFCVLWTHSIGDLQTGRFFLSDPVLKFLGTFNMPLFFMISGFFFVSSLRLSFKDVFRKKFLVLIIPHVTWTILIALVDLWMTFMGWNTAFSDKPFTILSQIQVLFIPTLENGGLWFFKDLFLTSMIVFVSCKIFKKRRAAFIVSMLFVMFFSFFGVVSRVQRFLLPFFWTGILLKVYYPVFCKYLNKLLIGSGVLLVVCFFFFDYTYMIYLSDFPPLINFPQSFATERIVFDFTNIGISSFRLLIGLVGSLFFFALFQRFWKKNNITSFLSRCGQLTVGVYGIQSIVLQRVMHNLLDFGKVNLWIYRFIITPSTSAFVFFICVLTIKLIQRSNPLAFVLFGSSLMGHKGILHKNQPLSEGLA
jgi:fucose 4-O-acetylase-like acetyltransferase